MLSLMLVHVYFFYGDFSQTENGLFNLIRCSNHGEYTSIVAAVCLNVQKSNSRIRIPRIYQSLKNLRVNLLAYAEIWNAFNNLIHI